MVVGADAHVRRKRTLEEYEKAVVALHSSLPPDLPRKQQREVRKKELNLFVDYCFGLDFPDRRREEIWTVRDRIDRKLLWLTLKYVVKRICRRSFDADLISLTAFMRDEYAKVLSPSELRTFLKLKEEK
ncbi:MAG: hypothetical protein ACTFAL_05610 [Candidatus Electronema sp. V4]|uniref:hypothetical protein n=1 Tax=Candidatus Electronema sp. V4 TaxID=3454756 RepID=UPI0040557433